MDALNDSRVAKAVTDEIQQCDEAPLLELQPMQDAADNDCRSLNDIRSKEAEEREIARLRESVCAGATAFLGYASVFCTLVVAAPLVLVYAVEWDGGGDVAAICCVGVGLLLCLWGVAPALPPAPRPPPSHGPFSATTAYGEGAGCKVEVRRIHLVVNPKSVCPPAYSLHSARSAHRRLCQV